MIEETEVDNDYQRYAAEIELYEKEFRPWVERSKKIVKIYKDADNKGNKKKRFNILWSNVQTLKPALYARDPNPEAERRHKDADPVGRVSAEVIERCLAYTVDCTDFGEVMRQCVDDRLLPGRGVSWVRYEPVIEGEGDDEELSYEKVIPDYVYWEDFGHNIARTWSEVTMVWRKVYMDRAKLAKRFPDVDDIPLDHTPKGINDEKIGEHLKKACIYEIWDREKKKVLFLSKGLPKIIEQKDDPLTLTNGFPCTKPLYATLTNDSLEPVPDYALYQTQALEIEQLTARINKLQKALKVAGVYDSSTAELGRLLNEGMENKMIPVDSWAAFAEKGGVAGGMQFLPIKEIAEVLIGLYEAREKSKADLYEITGIADIIRGNSDPRETAAAQQMKGRFAVLRISDAQQDVQNFAKELMRIMGEIIAEHFSLDTIKAISGIRLLMQAEKEQIQTIQAKEQQMAQQMQMQAQQSGQEPPQPPPSQVPPEALELMSQPTWEEVHGLLSNQVLREFRIGIETDSTIRTDEDTDRQERTEFLGVAGGFIDKAIASMQVAPELGPLMAELLMFGVRGHPAARNLEPVFDDAMKELQKPKPPRPDPEMAKIEAEKEMERERMQMQAQIDEKKMVNDVQAENAKQQAQHKEELQRQQLEDQRSQREMERTERVETHKTKLNMQATLAKINADARAKIRVAEIQAGIKSEEAEEQEQFEFVTEQEKQADREYEMAKMQSRNAVLAEVKELIGALNELKGTVH